MTRVNKHVLFNLIQRLQLFQLQAVRQLLISVPPVWKCTSMRRWRFELWLVLSRLRSRSPNGIQPRFDLLEHCLLPVVQDWRLPIAPL